MQKYSQNVSHHLDANVSKMLYNILYVNLDRFQKYFSNTLLVTVLFEAVNAVRVFTSQRNICLSNPADATSSLSLAYAKAFT